MTLGASASTFEKESTIELTTFWLVETSPASQETPADESA